MQQTHNTLINMYVYSCTMHIYEAQLNAIRKCYMLLLVIVHFESVHKIQMLVQLWTFSIENSFVTSLSTYTVLITSVSEPDSCKGRQHKNSFHCVFCICLILFFFHFTFLFCGLLFHSLHITFLFIYYFLLSFLFFFFYFCSLVYYCLVFACYFPFYSTNYLCDEYFSFIAVSFQSDTWTIFLYLSFSLHNVIYLHECT